MQTVPRDAEPAVLRNYQITLQEVGLLDLLRSKPKAWTISSSWGFRAHAEEVGDSIEVWESPERREHLFHIRSASCNVGDRDFRTYTPNTDVFGSLGNAGAMEHVYEAQSKTWIGATFACWRRESSAHPPSVRFFGPDGMCWSQANTNLGSGDGFDLVSYVSPTSCIPVEIRGKRVAQLRVARSASNPEPVSIEIFASTAPIDERVLLLGCLRLA
jgi:hypothetical protein